jgi:hypothetical protein
MSKRPWLWESLVIALISHGCGGGHSGTITAVGTPSADLTAPSATGVSVLPSCEAAVTSNAVGTWRAMSLQGAPPSSLMAGVWTGSELAVIEPDTREGFPVSLNAYDPILDRWRNIAVPNNIVFTPRTRPYLGVVAGKLIVYGGVSDPPQTGYLTDGWVIDLNDLTWAPMAPGPQLWPWGDPAPRVFADGQRAVFVPTENYFQNDDVSKNVAVVAYDLSTQTWETVPAPASTNGFFGCGGPGWNGSQVVCGSVGYLFTITSSPLAVKPFPSLDFSSPTGLTEMSFSPVGDMFFGLGPGTQAGTQQVFWVDPTRQIWSASTQVPGLGSRVGTVGGEVLVWGTGPVTTTSAGTVTVSLVAEVFDPSAGVWSAVTCSGAPTWPVIGVSVATPSGLIVFDGSTGSSSATANAVLEL